MARIWYPDVCFSGQCAIALAGAADDHPDNVIAVLCQHHQNIKNANALSNTEILRVIFQSGRVREAARWAVKQEFGLHKEHPGVPYRINSDGSFTLLTSPSDLAWRMPDGSAGPLPSLSLADRERAANTVQAIVDGFDRPVGTSAVRRLPS